ncbi:50S ribosomal protein L17 [bacterium]|nr:50S ribosomal protein L17 [bacterium]MBU1985481.1 50S ribosomal protein L17 [bacterium]
MRHLNRGRSLSRSPAHRKALLSNLAQELFQHKRIHTTLTKARELRPFAEKLVTTAKKGHIAARRQVLQVLTRKSVVKSLFEEIAPAYAERNGGYTRIVKLGPRVGDNAPLAVIELVGFEGVKPVTASSDSDKAAKKSAKAKSKTKAKRTKKSDGKESPKAKPRAAPKVRASGEKKSGKSAD